MIRSFRMPMPELPDGTILPADLLDRQIGKSMTSGTFRGWRIIETTGELEIDVEMDPPSYTDETFWANVRARAERISGMKLVDLRDLPAEDT
jgi:hypothetical protein